MTEQSPFDDLLAANQEFARDFTLQGTPGVAGAGVVMVTCMDSRIDPLGIIGLAPGDAKVVRNPGGRVTDQALTAVVLAVNLLQAERVLVVEHTLCAMASAPEAQLLERLTDAAGTDASWMSLGAIDDQERTIRADVQRVRSHPLVPATVEVGGFVYDVDTGLLQPVA